MYFSLFFYFLISGICSNTQLTIFRNRKESPNLHFSSPLPSYSLVLWYERIQKLTI